jgi:hypothetical protein
MTQELRLETLDVELSLVAERRGEVLGYSTLATPTGSDDASHETTWVLPPGTELAEELVRELVPGARAADPRRVVAWALAPWTERVLVRLGFRPGGRERDDARPAAVVAA